MPEQTKGLLDLEALGTEVKETRVALNRAERRRDAKIKSLHRKGVKPSQLARAGGVSASRVSQLVKPAGPKPGKASKPGQQMAVDEVLTEATPEPEPVRTAPLELLSSVVTTRESRRYNDRPTGWLPVLDNPLEYVLGYALRQGLERIYLTGGRPGDGTADACRQWFLEVPEGWDGGAHYLADPDLPVGRYTHRETGRKVEIHRAATWFGEGRYTRGAAVEAMHLVEQLLAKHFGHGQWLSTPATTGRDLWLRGIPRDREWHVMSDELRQLIAATSGQGRTELLAPAGDKLPGFAYLDGRLMYAGLVWGMPVAPVRWWTRAQLHDARGSRSDLLKNRGRWEVRVKVPADWSHVGLLMAPAGRQGWEYPAEPGRIFTTWADGAEVLLAYRHGWDVEMLQGVSWAEGKPLDTWKDKLVAAWKDAQDPSVDPETYLAPEVRRLAAGALRRVLLFTIGGFAQRSHEVWKSASRASVAGGLVVPPAGAFVTQLGDRMTWQETAPTNAYQAAMAHPEWAATIWARARVRLLSAPGETGALHLPREQLVAFRTDAIYTTADPRWSDDGAVGRFRLKGTPLASPGAWPTTWPELYRLRDLTEGES